MTNARSLVPPKRSEWDLCLCCSESRPICLEPRLGAGPSDPLRPGIITA